jgi:hypothetical protein
MSEVIKEFLVALGYKVDSSSEAAAKRSLDEAAAAAEAGTKRINDADDKATKERGKRSAQRRKNAADEAKSFDESLKSQVRSATTQGVLIAQAIDGMAKVAVNSIVAIVREFDALYFATQRTQASASNLSALRYAFEQMGGSADVGQ